MEFFSGGVQKPGQAVGALQKRTGFITPRRPRPPVASRTAGATPRMIQVGHRGKSHPCVSEDGCQHHDEDKQDAVEGFVWQLFSRGSSMAKHQYSSDSLLQDCNDVCEKRLSYQSLGCKCLCGKGRNMDRPHSKKECIRTFVFLTGT